MSEAVKKEDKVLYGAANYAGKVLGAIDEYNKTAKPGSGENTTLTFHDATGNLSETMNFKLDSDGQISNGTKITTQNAILSRDTNDDGNISASEVKLLSVLTEADVKTALEAIKKITYKNPGVLPALEEAYLKAGKDGWLSEAENILLTSQLKLLNAEPEKPNVPKATEAEPVKTR